MYLCAAWTWLAQLWWVDRCTRGGGIVGLGEAGRQVGGGVIRLVGHDIELGCVNFEFDNGIYTWGLADS